MKVNFTLEKIKTQIKNYVILDFATKQIAHWEFK